MGLETVKKYENKPTQTELNKRFLDLEKRMQFTGALTGDVHSDTEHTRRGQELTKFLKGASLEDVQTLSYHPKLGMLMNKVGGYPGAFASMDADKLGVLALNKNSHQELNSVLGALALPPELLNSNPNIEPQRQQAKKELHEKLETVSYSTTSKLEKTLRGLSNQLPSQHKEQVNNLIKEGLRLEKERLQSMVKKVTPTPSQTTQTSNTPPKQNWQQKQQAEKLEQQRLLKEQQEKLISQSKGTTVEVPKQAPLTVDSFVSKLGKGGDPNALRQDLSKLTQTPEMAKELMQKVGTGERLDQLMRLETQTVNQFSEIEARKQRLGAILPHMSNEQLASSLKSGQLSQIMGNTTDRYAEVAGKAFSPEQFGVIASNSNSPENITALGKMVSQLDKEDKTFAAKLRFTAQNGDFGNKAKSIDKPTREAVVGLKDQFERKVAVMNTKQEIKTSFKEMFSGAKLEKPTLKVGDVLAQSKQTSSTSLGQKNVEKVQNQNSVGAKIGHTLGNRNVQSPGKLSHSY